MRLDCTESQRSVINRMDSLDDAIDASGDAPEVPDSILSLV